MAKKNSKTKKVDETPVVNNVMTVERDDVASSVNLDEIEESVTPPMLPKKRISELNVVELMALEKACALLCKRYETIAQLDIINNIKFREFNRYYEMIFEELTVRVTEACKME